MLQLSAARTLGKILNQLGHYSSIDNSGRFVMYVGGNRSHRKPTLSERESPSLSHEEWVWLGIEPTTPEVTRADVNFEHRSHPCATRTAHFWQPYRQFSQNNDLRTSRFLCTQPLFGVDIKAIDTGSHHIMRLIPCQVLLSSERLGKNDSPIDIANLMEKSIRIYNLCVTWCLGVGSAGGGGSDVTQSVVQFIQFHLWCKLDNGQWTSRPTDCSKSWRYY
jgi:hypothetical protein